MQEERERDKNRDLQEQIQEPYLQDLHPPRPLAVSSPPRHLPHMMRTRSIARLTVLLTSMTACGETETATEPQTPIATSVTFSSGSLGFSLSFSSIGATQQLSVTVGDQDGDAIEGAAVAWASSDSVVATVSSAGLVTAISDGTATITATSGSASGSVEVAVQQVATSIALSPSPVVLAEPGDTVTVVASVTDALGSEVLDPNLIWSSEDDAIATVSDSGLVTAMAVGTATIGVELAGVERALTVTVREPLGITTTSLSDGVEGVDYGGLALQATGGIGAYSWALAAGSGALPSGLVLSVNGDLSGKPTVVGASTFTIEVTSGDGQVATQVLSITVNAPPVLQPSDFCTDYPDYAVVTFLEPRLELAVRGALGAAPEDRLTCALASTAVALTEESIRWLAGIQNLTGLTVLSLIGNTDGRKLTDIGELSGLPALTDLTLDNNSLDDYTVLSGLANLTALSLRNNAIGDAHLSVLGGLTGLSTLNLSNNSIYNLNALSGLTGLTNLNLRSNPLCQGCDISALGGFTNLTFLDLGGNDIGDISVLSELTGLVHLDLGGNFITDIAALTGLTSLSFLHLGGNAGLSNVQPLLDNPGIGPLDDVRLGGTNVSCSDVAALLAKGVIVKSNCPP